nr:zinc finger, CCHC-type [Tanacetum cinerariifolium]
MNFVRYDEHSKDFRFYVIKPTELVSISSIIESRDVIFEDNRFSSVPRPSLRIPDRTKDISSLVVPEEVIEEVLTDLPLRCKPLGCKWIFKRKLNVDGTIEKFKMDVKKTFLNGELDKEAPKQCHQKFDEVVLSSGYLHNEADKYVYSKFDEYGKGVIIFLYVDDMLIFGTDKFQVDLTKEFLSLKFSREDKGKSDVILVSTPMNACEKLMPNNGLAVSQLEYSRVIGCLMYAMTYTRPNTSFSVADGKEAKWLRSMILKVPLWSKPIAHISIYCDNAATIAKAYSQMYNGKSRHLGVKYSMILEHIMNGVIFIEFMRLLTKRFAYGLVFNHFCRFYAKKDDELNHGWTFQVDVNMFQKICLGVDLEPDEWIKDSRCSKHMSGNRKLFSTYKTYNGGNVIFGSNLHSNIIGKGQKCDNKCRVTLSELDSEINKDGKVIDENGIVSRNKARLVAQGYNQQEGIDYDETYDPVSKLESIRILLAYACALDFKLFQIDVKSKLLNGFMNEEDEALDKLKVFKTKVELQQGSLIKRFWTDRGGEYMDTLYFQSIHIIHETIAPYTPQQNGISKRKNRGCKAVVRLPDPKLKTLGERGIECIFVGYAEHSKDFSNESHDVSLWKEAINYEMDSIIGNDTWVLTDLPLCCKPLGCKWIFKRKLKVDGTIEKFKYHKTTDCFGINSQSDYSSDGCEDNFLKCQMASALYSMSSKLKTPLGSNPSKDLSSIEEEVYVCQPPGFKDLNFPDRVYKVKKALYGLHQAPRAWKELCIAFEKLMHEKFQMSSIGELTFFLGLQVKQKNDGIFISQYKYVGKFLKKLGKKQRSRTHKLKRLYKVALSARVESSDDNEDLEVAKKEVNDAGEVTVASIATTVSAVATITTEEITLAQALKALKTSKPKIRGIVIKDQEEPKKRRKFFVAKRAEKKRNKPPTQAQQRKIMCTYLMNMEGMKLKDLKNKSFDSIQKMFDRAFNRVNTFIDFRTELVKGAYGHMATVETSELSIWKFDESSKGVISCLYVDDMLIFGTDKVQVDMTKEFLSLKFSREDTRKADVILDIRIKLELMPNNGQAVSQLEYSWVIDCLMYAMTCTRPNISFSVVSDGKEAKWLRSMILEASLWSKPIAHISIYCDNAATLAKAYNQMYNGKSRHLGVKHSMILKHIMNGVIFIEFMRICLEPAEKEDEVFTSLWSLMKFSDLLFSECNSEPNGIHQSDGFSFVLPE